MIYKYSIENGILEQRSLFQLPFKSVNGYNVKVDNKPLVDKLDYTIEGSRLWIERDIAGKVFSISDGVEDEIETLLEKIEQIELEVGSLKTDANNNNSLLTELGSRLDELQELQSDKDGTYTELFTALKSETDNNKQALNSLKGTVDNEIDTLTELLTETETLLNKKIEDLEGRQDLAHNSLRDKVAELYEDMAENEDVKELQSKYTALQKDIESVKQALKEQPESIDKSVIEELSEKISSLRQSLAMETAQRIRADKEIKLLLDRITTQWEDVGNNLIIFQEKIAQMLEYFKKEYDKQIADLDKRVSLLEDIIILNDDTGKAELLFSEYKKEVTSRLSDLSRIMTANTTRLEKLRHKALGFDLELNNNTGILGKLLEQRLEELKKGGVI